MAEKIRVLIVDDLPETRENVRKLLQFESDVEVVAQAGDGDQAVVIAQQHQPDVILMDINMPGQDGISASQAITRVVPSAQIIIMSVQSEADYLRRAMLAGARDFLMKPFSGDELMAAIRRVYETRPKIAPVAAVSGSGAAADVATNVSNGHIISVYSPKGGSGCTTISINTAVLLATRGYKTALVDTSLQFGDVAVTLNLRPTTSIIDVVDRINELDADFVSSVMVEHDSGLKVLLAPPRPEMAEHIKAEHVDALLKQLAGIFDYVIVDTASALNDITLTVLDASECVVLATQQNLASLTDTKRFFDLLDILEYDASKVMLVVNRASDKFGIKVKDVSDALKRQILASVPSDEITVTSAADRGEPLVLSSKGRRDALVHAFNNLANSLEDLYKDSDSPNFSRNQGESADADNKKEKRSFFGNLFSR